MAVIRIEDYADLEDFYRQDYEAIGGQEEKEAEKKIIESWSKK